MTAATAVFVLLGEPRPRAAVSSAEATISPFTGKPIRRVELQVGVREHDHEALSDEIAAAAQRGGKPIVDQDGTSWKVVGSSYSYSDDGPATLYRHRADLEEIEELHIDEIGFEGIVVSVARSSLDVHDGVVVLDVLADTDAELGARIEAVLAARRRGDEPYFPVEWRGLKPDPVSMRFGRCLWQQQDNGSVRHLLVFVAEAGDADREPFLGINQPETDRLIDTGLATRSRLDALLAELRSAGVLSEEATQRIEQAGQNPPAHLRREMERADDVDQFFPGE